MSQRNERVGWPWRVLLTTPRTSRSPPAWRIVTGASSTSCLYWGPFGQKDAFTRLRSPLTPKRPQSWRAWRESASSRSCAEVSTGVRMPPPPRGRSAMTSQTSRPMTTVTPNSDTHARRVRWRREERNHSRSFSSSGSNLLEDTANLGDWVGMDFTGHGDRPERPAPAVSEAAPGVAPGPDHRQTDRVARALGPVDVLRRGCRWASGGWARQHGPVARRPPEVRRRGARRDRESAGTEADRHVRAARVPVPGRQSRQPPLTRAQPNHRPRDVLTPKDAQDLLRSRHLHQLTRIHTPEPQRHLIARVLPIDRHYLHTLSRKRRVCAGAKPGLNSGRSLESDRCALCLCAQPNVSKRPTGHRSSRLAPA